MTENDKENNDPCVGMFTSLYYIVLHLSVFHTSTLFIYQSVI